MKLPYFRRSLWLGTAALLLMPTTPALAQDADVAQRVDRLERELRAVQRRVFPGSEAGLFTPEATPGNGATTPADGAPPQNAVADLGSRIEALEAGLARLTGEVEQQGHRQQQLETAVAQLRADFAARNAETTTPSATPALTPTPTPAPVAVRPAATPVPAATRPTPAPTPAPARARTTTTPAPAATATTPANNADRRARVAAIEVPTDGDAGENAYIYGYRLWDAHFYPEAQTQLQRVIEQYPNHRRASFAGNLLGRAYLDNGQPSLAVQALYNNYRDRPRGERAADSVYYMGMALIRLNRREDACRTFDEFTRVYGSDASQNLQNQVAAGRRQAGC